MNHCKKAAWLRFWGYVFCIVPASVATLEHFPLWLGGQGEGILSVFGILVLSLCLIPFRRAVQNALKSPSAWQLWTVLFLVLWLTEKIAEGLLSVAAVAAVTSFLGAILFRLARRLDRSENTEAASFGNEERSV